MQYLFFLSLQASDRRTKLSSWLLLVPESSTQIEPSLMRCFKDDPSSKAIIVYNLSSNLLLILISFKIHNSILKFVKAVHVLIYIYLISNGFVVTIFPYVIIGYGVCCANVLIGIDSDA